MTRYQREALAEMLIYAVGIGAAIVVGAMRETWWQTGLWFALAAYYGWRFSRAQAIFIGDESP